MSEDTRPNKKCLKSSHQYPISQSAVHCKTFDLTTYNPIELGTFTLDDNRKYEEDSSAPELEMPEKYPLDLNKGFETFSKVESDGSLDPLLEWVKRNNFDLKNVNFITYRGILRKIGTTIFDFYRNHWSLKLCKHKDTVYIMESDTPQSIDKRKRETPKDKQFQYWGYKFEDYMTTAGVGSEHFNVSGGFHSVSTARVGKHRGVFAAEVDCKSDKGYVELKTNRVIQHDRQWVNFRKGKLLNTWAQCYIAGVPSVWVGFRDDQGMLKNVQFYDVCEMPAKCEREWSGSAVMSFLQGVLDWSLPLIQHNKTYVMSFLDHGEIELVLEGEGHFVPDWFTLHIKENENRDDDW